MFIGKRTVSAGVSVDLRAVDPQSAQLQHAHLTRQKQHLNEQPFDLLEESLPERRDGVVVGMIVSRDKTKRHRVISRPLQLPARKYPRRIAINQNAQQHPRMVVCAATGDSALGTLKMLANGELDWGQPLV